MGFTVNIDNKKVSVKWMDAKIYPGMHNPEDALKRKMDIFESLGYLIEQNDEATRIAHEITDSGEYRDILLIPSGSFIINRQDKWDTIGTIGGSGSLSGIIT